VTLTVDTARPQDIWPDPDFRPASQEVEDAIFAEAKRVTADDIARCGLNAAPWYCAFFIAEDRVKARLEAEQEKNAAEAKRRKSPPQPRPVARGGVHPSAMKWAKWPKPPDVDKLKDVPDRYREHLREWYQERAPGLGVYRPELDDRQTPTIGDLRKVHREVTIALDQAMCTIVYLSKRIKDLEARKMPEYRGIWQDGETYPESSLVTSQGSLWISKAQTKGVRPGDGSCWELAAKRGRDGRHAPRDGKDATT
jgi:hypothetical protein